MDPLSRLLDRSLHEGLSVCVSILKLVLQHEKGGVQIDQGSQAVEQWNGAREFVIREITIMSELKSQRARRRGEDGSRRGAYRVTMFVSCDRRGIVPVRLLLARFLFIETTGCGEIICCSQPREWRTR